MNIEELKRLIANDENVHLELKKTTGELKDGMHSACAFLNGAGGWLVFGVAPKSLKILGQEVTDNTQREIAQALSGLEPSVSIDIQYIAVPDRPGCQVIALYFEAFVWGTAPYTYHGSPYYKVESTTKLMPRNMFEERLRANKPNYYAWERQTADDITIDDMDEKLIRGAIRLGVEKNRMPATALTEPLSDVLRKLELMNEGVQGIFRRSAVDEAADQHRNNHPSARQCGERLRGSIPAARRQGQASLHPARDRHQHDAGNTGSEKQGEHDRPQRTFGTARMGQRHVHG